MQVTLSAAKSSNSQVTNGKLPPETTFTGLTVSTPYRARWKDTHLGLLLGQVLLEAELHSVI